MSIYKNRHFSLEVSNEGRMLYTTADGREYLLNGPRFPIDGELVGPELEKIEPTTSRAIAANETMELTLRARLAAMPDVTVETVFRVADDSPVLRLRYRLQSEREHRLTVRGNESGRDGSGSHQPLIYCALDQPPTASLTEVRFSEFNEMIHSFSLVEEPVSPHALEAGVQIMGPMLVQDRGDGACLLAYEHGSQYPDAFLAFRSGGNGQILLEAIKGNYLDREPLDTPAGFETIWFQFAAVGSNTPASAARGESAGSSVDRLASEYRRFQLRHATENLESRKPYIFYNTWAYQERNKWWNGKRFLDSMHHDRIIAEVERAHEMGIEVFVIDTGWYEKTGEWKVSGDRFPDGLSGVREALAARDMKLGLWFNPKVAAVSSEMLKEHRDCVMSRQGKEATPHPVWETEESYGMCLVSRFWEAFADELIRLIKELGVTYFKWDAISQYGCDSPHHYHGDESHSDEERADSYAFNLGRYMSKIVDKVCGACPEAIVDFDITEGKRYVGLGFLASGKYFLINNGPYYENFDVPADRTRWTNVFVHPGPARPWFCRTPLRFDRWIPSILFLTHYLPDDPADSQIINLASLMLGQNGIWGDLLSVSDQGVSLIAELLGYYKQVREDVTAADPVRIGSVGGGVEVHEKIAGESGRGLVAAFTNGGIEYTFVTSRPVSTTYRTTEGVDVEIVADGRARIRVCDNAPGAVIVFFGAE
ncbi:MAG: alpha-galactosidase [Spirochaetales bacterium]